MRDTLTTSYERLSERVLMLQSKCDATETLAKNTTAGALAGQVADLGADLAKLAQSSKGGWSAIRIPIRHSARLTSLASFEMAMRPYRELARTLASIALDKYLAR